MDFEVVSPYPFSQGTFHPKIMEFQIFPDKIQKTDCPDTIQPDKIEIEHIFSIPEGFKHLSDDKAVSRQTLWTVFQENNNWIYKKSPALPISDSSTIFMESSGDFSRNRIYFDCITEQEYKSGCYSSLSIFGCDQIIVSKLLATRKGALLHANGFVVNNQGFLLAGPSTAGKTTLSGMLREKGFQMFSDDRAIVCFENDQCTMKGSWFHGSTPVTSTGSFPLKGIFFLKHARENIILPINSGPKKIGAVLQSLVRPHITTQEWQSLLGTIEKISRYIPCYELRFDLSGAIVSLISRLANHIQS